MELGHSAKYLGSFLLLQLQTAEATAGRNSLKCCPHFCRRSSQDNWCHLAFKLYQLTN